MVRISLDPEVEKLLRESDVDIFALLANDPAIKGQFRRIAASKFSAPTDSGQRMDPLTIAASGVVIVALGSAIERIIKVLTRRPVVLTHERYESALDTDGKPVLDSDGKPVWFKSTTQTYEEPKDANAPVWEANMSASELRVALGKKRNLGGSGDAQGSLHRFERQHAFHTLGIRSV